MVVNLLAIPLPQRPGFLAKLLSALLQLRIQKGRPHRIVIDEAHHMLSPSSTLHASEMSQQFDGLIMVTVHADQLSAAALSKVNLLVVVGDKPEATIRLFCEQTGREIPGLPVAAPSPEQVLVWNVDTPSAELIRRPEPRGERRRHIRKYAEGRLGEDKSFYFSGRENRLNLRAHNLSILLADGGRRGRGDVAASSAGGRLLALVPDRDQGR